MTVESTIRLQPGSLQCSVVSDTPSLHGPCIVIPIAHLSTWTDDELVQAVKALVPHAEYAKALSIADWLLHGSDDNSFIGHNIIDTHAEEIQFIERWRGNSREIDAALARVDMARARKRIAANVPAIRKEAKVNYDGLFMTVGRRDGFYCQTCGSHAADLTLDHRFPVMKGGTNALENLQLLCAKCNNEKRAK